MMNPTEWEADMSRNFRPLLAASVGEIERLRPFYPFLVTPKIDGIRCITRPKTTIDMFEPSVVEGVSRTLKPIPNRHIQLALGKLNKINLDGELVTYTDDKMDSYNDVQSKVMSETGKPLFVFYIFDVVAPQPYWERMEYLKCQSFDQLEIVTLLPKLVQDEAGLLAYEQACLLQGFEGVMLRDIDGPYKFGRSTFNQRYLLKLKRFKDAEATVIGFQELMHNENEQEEDKLGLMKRSDHKANLVHGDTLGALICSGHNGQIFNIGSGFTDEQRRSIWLNKSMYEHALVTYKYQPHGQKDAPRCPVFKGFRDVRDV